MDGRATGEGRRKMREALIAIKPDATDDEIEATLDEMFLRLGGLYKQYGAAIQSDAFECAARVAEQHSEAGRHLAQIFRRMAAEARG